MQQTASRIGYWAAVLVALEVILFAVLLIVEFWGFSAIYYTFAICLLLAPSYVTLIVCVHHQATPASKIWGQLGAAFAIIYAVLVAENYYVQLSAIRTNSFGISDEVLQLFQFQPGSILFSIDMLGYVFLCVSTLFLAPVFSGSKLDHWLRRLCQAHGLLFIPTLIFPLLTFPQDTSSVTAANTGGSIALLAWCLVFLPIPILLAIRFRRQILYTSGD